LAVEVQSETPQVVRSIGFLRSAPSPQPEVTERQQARHLVEALLSGHQIGSQGIGAGNAAIGIVDAQIGIRAHPAARRYSVSL
jgi:hypothetical protein